MPKASGEPKPAQLAAQLRLIRAGSGMTQSEFARVLGVRQQKLSEWECGKGWRAVLDARRVLRILPPWK